MTLKYESELLFDLMKRDGDDAPSVVLPYESELKEKYLKQVEGAYPKLIDYRSEWLNYNLNVQLPADFPMETLSDVTNATVHNVVPYEYGSAILKGNTDENLQSVKMPVLTTTGKNLYNSSNPTMKTSWWIGEENGVPILKKEEYSTNYSVIIPAKGNTKYTYNGNNMNRNYYSFLDKDYNVLHTSDIIQATITSPQDTAYVLFYLNSDDIEEVSNLQVEEGELETSYEPYKSIILTVNEEVTLRGIGDVKDELNLLTGEVTQRIGETTLDGSEGWWMNKMEGNNTNRFRIKFDSKKDNKIPTIKCNALKCIPNEKWYTDEEIIEADGVNLTIRKTFDSEKEFTKWLSQNPITIQYQTKTELIKTVDLRCINEQGESVKFRPIEGTMHVSTSSQALTPLLDMSVPVEATTQNLMSFANIVEEE